MRGLTLLAAIALAAACAPPAPDIARDRPAGPAVTVWVVDHGWHTAIAVRRADVDRALWPAIDELPSASFLEVAWGDRDFYTTPGAGLGLALKAALGSGGSVLHVAGLDAPPAAVFPRSESVELRLSPRGFEALTRFVGDEFERGSGSGVIRLGRGLYGSSGFYVARGRYSLSNTCNTWVARALHAADVPLSPDGVVTAGDLMARLRTARSAP